MAVMNEVNEAGSAYLDSRIELVINRRLFKDDNLGMSEGLNEMDSKSKGLSVITKYYLQFTQGRDQATNGIRERKIITS